MEDDDDDDDKDDDKDVEDVEDVEDLTSIKGSRVDDKGADGRGGGGAAVGSRKSSADRESGARGQGGPFWKFRTARTTCLGWRAGAGG
jgi:hypothetical protein